jgi:hypothetical protein
MCRRNAAHYFKPQPYILRLNSILCSTTIKIKAINTITTGATRNQSVNSISKRVLSVRKNKTTPANKRNAGIAACCSSQYGLRRSLWFLFNSSMKRRIALRSCSFSESTCLSGISPRPFSRTTGTGGFRHISVTVGSSADCLARRAFI